MNRIEISFMDKNFEFGRYDYDIEDSDTLQKNAMKWADKAEEFIVLETLVFIDGRICCFSKNSRKRELQYECHCGAEEAEQWEYEMYPCDKDHAIRLFSKMLRGGKPEPADEGWEARLKGKLEA